MTTYKERAKNIFSMLKTTYFEWNEDEPFRQSAVIAYYSIFSLPALLIIIINVIGYIWGEEAVRGQISAQMGSLVGEEAATQVEDIVASMGQQGNSFFAVVIGIGTLLFGATGVFYQLQQSLNKVWEVELKPKTGYTKLAIEPGYLARSNFGYRLLIAGISCDYGDTIGARKLDRAAASRFYAVLVSGSQLSGALRGDYPTVCAHL